MPKKDLAEAILFSGTTYGPGKAVEVPDDPTLLARIDYFNEEARIRNEALAEEGLSLLPAGHPYRELYPQVTNQPPEFEGEALSPATAAFAVAQPVRTVYLPDGISVSGGEVQDNEPFEAGAQSLTPVDPETVAPKAVEQLAKLELPTSSGDQPATAPQASSTTAAKPAATTTSTGSTSGSTSKSS